MQQWQVNTATDYGRHITDDNKELNAVLTAATRQNSAKSWHTADNADDDDNDDCWNNIQRTSSEQFILFVDFSTITN